MVVVSLVIVAPAAPKLSVPDPSVTSACPLVPSVPGIVNDMFEATVPGAFKAT